MASWGGQVPEAYTQATGLPAPQLPAIPTKPVTVPAGARVGGSSRDLGDRTEVAGRCDATGRQF